MYGKEVYYVDISKKTEERKLLMIITGIDQFTLILQSNLDGTFDDWINWEAEKIINDFMERSKMLDVMLHEFGVADCKIPTGYTNGYSFKYSPYYFCIALNTGYRHMGLIVKFSSYCWSVYKERYALTYGSPIELHKFLRLTESPNYSQRLSRVDPFVDFINEGINVAKLKKSIESGRTQVYYGRY